MGGELQPDGHGAEVARDVEDHVILAAQRGERSALAIIIEHYTPRLRHLVYHLLADEEAVDDVLQEVYLKVFRHLKSFRRQSSLGTWLYRVTYTTCISALRHPAWSSLVDDLPERADVRPSPEEEAISKVRLVTLLHQLPLDERAAVLLVDAYDLGYRRAAEVLGTPTSTIASRVTMARRTLREALRTADSPSPSPLRRQL
jgi:RNA polymerase sigma-70 factor (ECF subfamily)